MSRTNATLSRPASPLEPVAVLAEKVRSLLGRECKPLSYWLECPMRVGHAACLVASGLLLTLAVLTAALPSHPYGWASVELMLGIQLLVPVLRQMKEGGAE